MMNATPMIQRYPHAEASPSMRMLSGFFVRSFVFKLPKMRASQCKQALALALPDESHWFKDDARVVINTQDEDGWVGVCVMQKEDHQNMLAALQQETTTVTHIIPDFLTLPYQKNHITLLFREDRMIFRESRHLGGAVALDRISMMLQSLQAAQPQARFDVYAAPPAQQNTVRESLPLEPTNLRFHEDAPTPSVCSINMLSKKDSMQQSAASSEKGLKKWGLALAASILCFMFALIGPPWLQAHRIQKANRIMDQNNQRIAQAWGLHTNDPTVLHATLKRILMQQGNGKKQIMPALARMQHALRQAPSITLLRLHYADAAWHAVLNDSTGHQASHFITLMQAQGFKVTPVQTHADPLSFAINFRRTAS